MRRFVGVLVLAAGLWLATFPFLSVWSVTGDALGRLPEVASDGAETDRNWLAMFSNTFILAERTYENTSGERLADALSGADYEPATAQGERWWTRSCCGDYDAVWVKVEEAGNSRATAIVSVYDDDIQATWPFISGVGLVVSVAGLLIARPGRSQAGTPRQLESSAA